MVSPAKRKGRGLLRDPVTLGPLALHLARTANGGGLFTGAHFTGLLVMTAKLHFAIDAFALQLLLERAQSLVDVVIANDDLHKKSNTSQQKPRARIVWRGSAFENIRKKRRIRSRKRPNRGALNARYAILQPSRALCMTVLQG